MTDEEVTTKAPESDAQEDAGKNPTTDDPVARAGPTMGEHCTSDRPTPSGEVPTGELTKLGDVDVYIAKPADYPHSPSKLLLLLTGGTGLKSANNQLQADKYASEGFLVIMPDQFEGDPAPNAVSEPLPEHEPSFLDRVKHGIVDGTKSFMIDMWLARHTPEKVLPLLHKVISAAKEEFADAIANGGGIYGVGYCFGAKYILLLAGEHPDSVIWGHEKPGAEEEGMIKKGPLIKVGVVAHGTGVTPTDIASVKVPVSLICVQDDPMFPEEIWKAGEDALVKSGIEHEVKIYPGVPHGFAVLGDYDDTKIKEAQQQAFGEMLGWLQAR